MGRMRQDRCLTTLLSFEDFYICILRYKDYIGVFANPLLADSYIKVAMHVETSIGGWVRCFGSTLIQLCWWFSIEGQWGSLCLDGQ
jgi:hypothetical protein